VRRRPTPAAPDDKAHVDLRSLEQRLAELVGVKPRKRHPPIRPGTRTWVESLHAKLDQLEGRLRRD
jgi:hypothetical protein